MPSATRTIRLEDGKYEATRDDRGLLVDMKRNGERWEEGLAAFAYAKVFHAALNEIERLRGIVPEVLEQLNDGLCEENERLRAPIDMVLHCPACGMQHIDAPEDERDVDICRGPEVVDTITVGWDNPPHRSHLCGSCGHIWRPADVPTNGVAAIKTKGKNDSPVSAGAESETESKRMFVARLENMREQGHTWMTIPAVLALLNDCDMLASR